MTLSTNNAVSMRPIRSTKRRPFTMYDGFTKFQINLESTSNVNNNKMASKNAYNIYNIPTTSVDKKCISCNNLSNINSVQERTYKNTPTMKRTLSIRRPKSLQRLHDELRPLLDTASSLSSIGSYNELTEESIIDSSDDSRSMDINNVVLRKGGKLRSLKHRTRCSTTVLTDRNLGSIPENLLAHNLRKRHGIHSQSLNHIACNDNSSGLENILTDFGIDDERNPTQRHSIDRSRSVSLQRPDSRNGNPSPISSNCVSMQNIAIPRRKSKANELSQAVSAVSISEQSFSKEQKKRLKKKMRDTKRSPENSVFLGLF